MPLRIRYAHVTRSLSEQRKHMLDRPLDAETAVLLSVRASWAHIAAQLQDRANLEACVWQAVVKLEGMRDEVVIDMMMRHVSQKQYPLSEHSAECPPCRFAARVL